VRNEEKREREEREREKSVSNHRNPLAGEEKKLAKKTSLPAAKRRFAEIQPVPRKPACVPAWPLAALPKATLQYGINGLRRRKFQRREAATYEAAMPAAEKCWLKASCGDLREGG